MRTLSLILILSLSVFQEVVAEFFKWEILFAGKGFGTEYKIIPVVAEGKIEFADKKIECLMKNFWTSIESELLVEGKTLACLNGDKESTVSVICRDNSLNRKYNQVKELYPITKAGFWIDTKLGSDSPYLELRCYY